MIINNLTSVRVNFLKAFENKNGRKATVTRKELVDFAQTWQTDEVGGTGLKLRFPSWLTNGKPNLFKVSRGQYRLPWEELDTYDKMSAAGVLTAGPSVVAAAFVTTIDPAEVTSSVVSTNPEIS